MGQMSSQNMPFPWIKVAILLLDLPCSGIVTHSGKILNTVKSPIKKPDGLFPKDDTEMKKRLHMFLNEIAILTG